MNVGDRYRHADGGVQAPLCHCCGEQGRGFTSASSAAWAALRASVSSAHTKNSSPAVGTALRPDIWTASEGVADSTSPVDSVSVLTCGHHHIALWVCTVGMSCT